MHTYGNKRIGEHVAEMQVQQARGNTMTTDGVAAAPVGSNVKQHMVFLESQVESLEIAINMLAESMDSAGILAAPGPEAPIPSIKGPEPTCPLSGAIHEMVRRIEHRTYALREMRQRLAA